MGQYYKILNLDKKQYLHPHKFGDGLKLLEFGSSGDGTMCGLAVLLADGNGRGGGDLRSEHPIVGTWARDRIVVAGDYADNEPGGELNLFHMLTDDDGKPIDGWADVSDEVLLALADDAWVAESLVTGLKWRGNDLPEPLLKKLKDAEKRREEREKRGDKQEPPHVRLAHAVLKTPEDTKLWAVFLDAALEAAGR